MPPPPRKRSWSRPLADLVVRPDDLAAPERLRPRFDSLLARNPGWHNLVLLRPDAGQALNTLVPPGAALPPGAAAFLSASGFAAKAQEVALLPGGEGDGGLAGAVLGLGDAPPDPWSFGALPDKLPAGGAWRFAEPGEWAAQAVLGWCLGAYRFTRFKPAKREPARLVPPPGTDPVSR